VYLEFTKLPREGTYQCDTDGYLPTEACQDDDAGHQTSCHPPVMPESPRHNPLCCHNWQNSTAACSQGWLCDRCCMLTSTYAPIVFSAQYPERPRPYLTDVICVRTICKAFGHSCMYCLRPDQAERMTTDQTDSRESLSLHYSCRRSRERRDCSSNSDARLQWVPGKATVILPQVPLPSLALRHRPTRPSRILRCTSGCTPRYLLTETLRRV